MIEQVARALHDSIPGNTNAWDSLDDTWCHNFRIMARAAIAAMREPTEAMLEAGDKRLSALGCWQDMIDTVLGEYHENSKS